jgi:hypothetical protein
MENEGENEGAREHLPMGKIWANAPNGRLSPQTPDLGTPNRIQNCSAEMIGPIKTTRDTDCILGRFRDAGIAVGLMLTKINLKRVSVRERQYQTVLFPA